MNPLGYYVRNAVVGENRKRPHETNFFLKDCHYVYNGQSEGEHLGQVMQSIPALPRAHSRPRAVLLNFSN